MLPLRRGVFLSLRGVGIVHFTIYIFIIRDKLSKFAANYGAGVSIFGSNNLNIKYLE